MKLVAARLCLTAIVVGTIHVVNAAPAAACSCAYIEDARSAVRAADAAFVGMYVRRDDPQRGNEGPISSAREVTNHFVVEADLKGNLADRVRVVTPASEASCGLSVARGRRTGLLLMRKEGRWTSSLCEQVAPDRLEAASEGLPRVTTAPTPIEGSSASDAGSSQGDPARASWPLILVTMAVIAAATMVMAWRLGRRSP